MVSLGVDGTTLWQASYDGARLGRIARGNGVVTAFAYRAEGLPAQVLTGLGEGSGEVAYPLHRLAFTWTLGQLQRSRLREDIQQQLWAFHYDSLGHLEDKAGHPAWPAVKRLEPAWQLPGLPVPASLVESWQVGQADELLRRDRRQAGRHEPLSFSHNLLHQVTQGTGSLPVSYTWDVNGNLQGRSGGLYGEASFTHDELDRLVRVEQGGATTELVLDPLGRLVGKVRHSPEGEMARAYLHDGDQVVVEYGKGAGSASWRAQRRHLWGRWIDDLAVEQVDTDGDGVLETSLWPVSDLLGSIELVTDGSGSIVERFSYDPEGRPQFWSADTQRPRVTRVAWTGDGSDSRCPAGIPAVACPASAFQLAFGEELDAASASAATASLTAEGGSPQALALSLTPEARAAYLTGAALQAGIRYSLHLEGLRDRAGNLLWQWGAHTGAPLLTFTLTDPTVFQVLGDTAPPRLLAAVDAQDGLYLAWEEPVEVASGFTLDTSIAVLRQGQPVAGNVTRLSPQLFRWQPVEESQWLAGGQYTLSAVHLQDLSGKAATAPSVSFTHMAASPQVAYLVYQAPSDSQPQARSAYGLTTLFQGRTWHEELGLYHYRARWYLPEAGVFAERDPEGYRQSPSLYQFLDYSPVNAVDPYGKATVHVWRYRGSRVAWGHASMTLEDGTYISWWPQSDQGRPIKFWTKWVSRDIYEAPAFENRTFKDDLRGERQPPDNEIKLRSLNEPAIKIWWENYKRDPRWRTLDRNCSTTVATALKLGMPEEFKSGPQWWWVSQNLVWTPEDVEALALYIQKKEQEAAERKQAPEGQLEQFLKPLSLGRGEVSRAWAW